MRPAHAPCYIKKIVIVFRHMLYNFVHTRILGHKGEQIDRDNEKVGSLKKALSTMQHTQLGAPDIDSDKAGRRNARVREQAVNGSDHTCGDFLANRGQEVPPAGAIAA